MYRFYDSVFKLLEKLNFLNVTEEKMELLNETLEKIMLDKEVRQNSTKYINAIINFVQQNDKYRKNFDNIIKKENIHEFNKHLYALETSDIKDIYLLKKYIEEISRNIKTRGKNGTYSFSTYNPYNIIKYFIKYNSNLVDRNIINEIIEICKESLLANNITYFEKICAIQLLIFIKQNIISIIMIYIIK